MGAELRDTLIRAYTMDMRRNHGNVVVANITRRRVDFQPLAKPGQTFDVQGAVLIDGPESLGPIAAAVRQGIGFLVMIRATDELLWVPVLAEQDITGYWRIELVPWIDYLRASASTDEQIIREANQP